MYGEQTVQGRQAETGVRTVLRAAGVCLAKQGFHWTLVACRSADAGFPRTVSGRRQWADDLHLGAHARKARLEVTRYAGQGAGGIDGGRLSVRDREGQTAEQGELVRVDVFRNRPERRVRRFAPSFPFHGISGPSDHRHEKHIAYHADRVTRRLIDTSGVLRGSDVDTPIVSIRPISPGLSNTPGVHPLEMPSTQAISRREVRQ
ncbi:hypothetical protein BAN20980_00391 [Burkholderia anthina]|uniref:Uncharacterized protein n=1 Tax=Burkholderia anthina TaxID=179879 RepID=A0A6P2G2V9_9BURK|nr:hypothetical protein BAN20980_00391 [Burkholderia anthina]